MVLKTWGLQITLFIRVVTSSLIPGYTEPGFTG